jgi:uncharacterized protein (TIGR00255 family)
MTGYGRATSEKDGLRVNVEISSVNRKQLDVALALPREWLGRENDLRKAIAGSITRGRVQVRVTAERVSGSDRVVVADTGLLEEYKAKLRELLGEEPVLTVPDLLRLPGVLDYREAEAAPEGIGGRLAEALAQATTDWDAMRLAEGDHLRADIESRLALVEAAITAMDERAPGVLAAQREQLRARLEQAGVDLDLGDERVTRELALFADRCDTSEERVRLRSHLAQFRQLMEAKEPPGRTMDFLLQEMNREVNTIGSKASDAPMARQVVAAKTELEKIREQVQNIE